MHKPFFIFLYKHPNDYPLSIKVCRSIVKMKDICFSNRSSCAGCVL